MNPDPSGLDRAFVPGEPSEALICRYAAVIPGPFLPDGTRRVEHGGALYSSTHLDRPAATALATTLNDITPSSLTAGCQPPLDNARYTAIVFAVPGRSDVDVWLKDWYGCPEVSNGHRFSGELINGVGSAFIALLDADAAPASPKDSNHP